MSETKDYTDTVFIFDCVGCGKFYGEQTLCSDGTLTCPVCGTEERIDSDYVERMKVRNLDADEYHRCQNEDCVGFNK
jgi:predicted hydrocarbon binding protein